MKLAHGIRLFGVAAVVAFALSGPASGQDRGGVTLNCAGATLPAPLFQQWFQEYQAQTGVQVHYQPIGSSGGIKNVTAQSIDFAASDKPLTDAEMQAVPGLLQVPMAADGVCVVYNVPGVPPHIHLTGDVLARMFLGRITSWRDPALSALNPGTNFPNVPVIVWHLAKGSGTTKIFTTYLSQASPAWKAEVGSGSSVHWPFGLGDHGDLQSLRRDNGSIGYIDLAYAVRNNVSYADLQNAKGRYIAPSVASMTAAQKTSLPPDFRARLADTSAPDGYPLTGFLYFLAYRGGTKPAVRDFLQWALTDGQTDAAPLLYAPLAPAVQTRALAAVSTMH